MYFVFKERHDTLSDRPSWSWSYGSWIYNYLGNQWVRIPLRRGVLDTTLCDKVCQWFAAGRWFFPGTPVYSTNKTYRYDITELLLKVALNTITLTPLSDLLHVVYILCMENTDRLLLHRLPSRCDENNNITSISTVNYLIMEINSGMNYKVNSSKQQYICDDHYKTYLIIYYK
jgi:hypothetical protein